MEHWIATWRGASKGMAAAFLLLLAALPGPAAAQDVEESFPIYNPQTKSYFQLFTDNREGLWDTAHERALAKTFKGVPGRLAVVESRETHEFILSNFKLRHPLVDVWIGLRYWCKVRMLQWEGERLFSPSDAEHFSLWHNPWNREGSDCGDFQSARLGYMPVYYRTVGSLTRWQATTASKGFKYYLVEYPTGQE